MRRVGEVRMERVRVGPGGKVRVRGGKRRELVGREEKKLVGRGWGREDDEVRV